MREGRTPWRNQLFQPLATVRLVDAGESGNEPILPTKGIFVV